jgi:hypothetical protein
MLVDIWIEVPRRIEIAIFRSQIGRQLPQSPKSRESLGERLRLRHGRIEIAMFRLQIGRERRP